MDQRDIEVLAYFIWESKGKPQGQSLENWLEAEYLVRTDAFVREFDEVRTIEET